MSSLNGFLLWYAKDYSCTLYVPLNTVGCDPLRVAHIRVPMSVKVDYNVMFGHEKFIENLFY